MRLAHKFAALNCLSQSTQRAQSLLIGHGPTRTFTNKLKNNQLGLKYVSLRYQYQLFGLCKEAKKCTGPFEFGIWKRENVSKVELSYDILSIDRNKYWWELAVR